MAYKITWRTHIICLVLAFAVSAVFFKPIDKIISNFIMSGIVLYPTRYMMLNFFAYLLLMLIPVSFVHELIHGAVYKIFGGRVKYGFKGIYAYTQEVSGKPMAKAQLTIILLSPLVLMSISCLLKWNWLTGMVFLLNLLGSMGDAYMAASLCRYKRGCRIVDRSYGFDVIDIGK